MPHLSHSESVSRRPAYLPPDAVTASEETAAGPWVDTDPYGRVIDASPEGARLFNLTVRGLTGRNLSLFFISRQVIADGLLVLRRGNRECPLLETEYRPMERRRRRLRVKMGISDGDAVRWTFSEVLGDGSAPPLLNPS
jgi:PAS domain-containing protein